MDASKENCKLALMYLDQVQVDTANAFIKEFLNRCLMKLPYQSTIDRQRLNKRKPKVKDETNEITQGSEKKPESI